MDIDAQQMAAATLHPRCGRCFGSIDAGTAAGQHAPPRQARIAIAGTVLPLTLVVGVSFGNDRGASRRLVTAFRRVGMSQARARITAGERRATCNAWHRGCRYAHRYGARKRGEICLLHSRRRRWRRSLADVGVA